MNGAILPLRWQRETVAITFFSDLGKNERPDMQLALRLDINGGDEDRSVRERIPSAPVFLDVLIRGYPIKGNDCRSHGEVHELEHNGEEEGSNKAAPEPDEAVHMKHIGITITLHRISGLVTEALIVGDAGSRVEATSTQKALLPSQQHIVYLTICTLY